MHVELSLLYKTSLIIEMRSKILKAKGGTVQVLNNVDIFSVTKVIDKKFLGVPCHNNSGSKGLEILRNSQKFEVYSQKDLEFLGIPTKNTNDFP